MQMSTHEMNGSQAKQVSKFLHTVSDFERLGDHAVNISEVAAELNEKKIAFSDEAQYELDVLENAVKSVSVLRWMHSVRTTLRWRQK